MEKRYFLKAFRIVNGLTQQEMAKICGCGLITYHAIENGKRDGSLKFWEQLKEKFKLTGDNICEFQQKRSTQEF